MTDEQAMRLALAEAAAAAAAGEVPVGAVVVQDGQVIGSGRNSPRSLCDPSAHAELLALREAARTLGNYRLDGCELFVTVEPCAMCAGAVQHARLSRVVYGAAEPKTGAAGSVIDLFSDPRLNHHTQCRGGLLATESTELLQSFFGERRLARRSEASARWPLREDALRTPQKCFAGLVDYPWAEHYLNDLEALDGLRLHYLDEGPRTAPLTWLCVHGNMAWSYLWRHMIPPLLDCGARVVAPDLIGFGKSDKPKKESFHTFSRHRDILLEFIERLDLRNVVLVVHGWGGIVGLTVPPVCPKRWFGLLAINTMLATGDEPVEPAFRAWRQWCATQPGFDVAQVTALLSPQSSAADCAGYAAPFPDRGHQAALRRLSALVPVARDSDGAVVSQAARSFWRNAWRKRSMFVVGAHDGVLGLPAMQRLRGMVAGSAAPLVFEHAGHLVPEHGAEIAQAALEVFHR